MSSTDLQPLWQLAHFRANLANKGKVLDNGVWRYSCHPNYFGDAAQWWAYYLIALAASGWWTIFSPILMTTLLLRVSGVTMLKKALTQFLYWLCTNLAPEYKRHGSWCALLAGAIVQDDDSLITNGLYT